jgi:hypothetical protein
MILCTINSSLRASRWTSKRRRTFSRLSSHRTRTRSAVIQNLAGSSNTFPNCRIAAAQRQPLPGVNYKSANRRPERCPGHPSEPLKAARRDRDARASAANVPKHQAIANRRDPDAFPGRRDRAPVGVAKNERHGDLAALALLIRFRVLLAAE